MKKIIRNIVVYLSVFGSLPSKFIYGDGFFEHTLTSVLKQIETNTKLISGK